jgi:hypothetical protein
MGKNLRGLWQVVHSKETARKAMLSCVSDSQKQARHTRGMGALQNLHRASLGVSAAAILQGSGKVGGHWSQSRYTDDDWWEKVGIIGVSDEVNEQMTEWYRAPTSEREGFRKGVRVLR